MLGDSDQVGTTAEPWLLLPLWSVMRDEGTYADYGFNLARRAILGFRRDVEGGAEVFDDEVRRFVRRLYTRASPPEAAYFLDKTPRYHLFAADILNCFSSAKAIILWRNPLSMVASMMQTWAHGKWNLYRYKVDLYGGIDNLVSLAEEDRSSVLQVNYESLITHPDAERERIEEFLGIRLPGGADAPSKVEGELGDPTQSAYSQISTEPLTKWKKTIRNPIRRAWMRRYLRWIGASRLETMGYDEAKLLSDLHDVSLSTEYLATDLIRWVYGKLHESLEIELFANKFDSWKTGSYVVSHR